jgi:gliding motility-associated-like protein
MMRRDILPTRLWVPSVVLLTLCAPSLMAQNLVTDPGFEAYSNCPTSADQTDRLTHWSRTTRGSSDFFHTCGSGYATAPATGFGFAHPKAGGGMAGLVTWTGAVTLPDYREYLTGTLTDPLEAGRPYRVAYHVTMGEDYGYASNGFGAYLTDTLPTWDPSNDYPVLSDTPWSMTPQMLYDGAPVADTANWVLIEGEFTAAGGERLVVIGSFLNDANVTLEHYIPWESDLAYYFIDEVIVERVYYPPVAVNDTVEGGFAETLRAAVADNDHDADGFIDAASVSIVVPATRGTATVEAGTGDILWTPDPGFTGADSLAYRITDDEGLADTAWVHWRVTGAPLPPLAVADSAEGAFGQPIALALLANDLAGSWALDPASVTLIGGNASAGTATWDATAGLLRFVPAPGFCGVAEWAYRVADLGGQADTASITLTVTCPQTVCVDDERLLDGGATVAVAVLANDTPGAAEWDLTSLELLNEPEDGSVFWRNDELVFTAPPHTTSVRLAYRACNELGSCDEADVVFRVTAGPTVEAPQELFIPNVITPNGDGLNEAWEIRGLDAYAGHELTVFNRWGQTVFASTAYTNRWNAAQLPDGSYFYVLRYSAKDGRSWQASGHLMVLR